MATRLPTASRNAAVDGVVDRLDAGSGAGTIDVRTGSQPATANDAATGTLLLTFTLNDPAFGAAGATVAGRGDLDVTPALATVGLAAGTAGWFRAKDSDGNTVLDGAVTGEGGGGELELSTTTVSVGLDVGITSGTVTQPAG